MRNLRFWPLVWALVIGLSPHAVDAQAANVGSNPGISQKIASCDYSYPGRCLKVNADGSINTSGGGGGSSGGTATAAAPTYTEGATSQPLSLDLSGGLRIVTTGLATSALQTTGNTYLSNLGSSIGTKAPGTAPALALQTAGVYNSSGVTLTGGQGAALQMDAAGGLMGSQLTSGSVPINVNTATTTQLVALSGTKKIYVTSIGLIAGGTGNVTFVYGTGSACGTGTTALTGAYPLVAQANLTMGSGLGAVLVTPAGQALCVTTSAAVQMSGSVSYAQY